MLIDALDPTERAVFLLHDVFGYAFDEVADAVGQVAGGLPPDRQPGPQACSTTSASSSAAPTTSTRAADGGELSTAMLSGDIPGLMDLLSPDVVQLDDGGPNRHAGRRPIVGPHRVARLMVNIAKRMRARFTRSSSCGSTGTPGVLLRVDGRPTWC